MRIHPATMRGLQANAIAQLEALAKEYNALWEKSERVAQNLAHAALPETRTLLSAQATAFMFTLTGILEVAMCERPKSLERIVQEWNTENPTKAM